MIDRDSDPAILEAAVRIRLKYGRDPVPAFTGREMLAWATARYRVHAWLREKYRDDQPTGDAPLAPRKVEAPLACFPVSESVEKGRKGAAAGKAARRAKRGSRPLAAIRAEREAEA